MVGGVMGRILRFGRPMVGILISVVLDKTGLVHNSVEFEDRGSSYLVLDGSAVCLVGRGFDQLAVHLLHDLYCCRGSFD